MLVPSLKETGNATGADAVEEQSQDLLPRGRVCLMGCRRDTYEARENVGNPSDEDNRRFLLW